MIRENRLITKEEALAYAAVDRKVIVTPQNEVAALFGLGVELFVEPRERGQLRLDMLGVQEDYYRRFSSFIDLMNFVSGAGGRQIGVKKGDDPFQAVKQTMGNLPTNRAYTNTILGQFTHPDYPNPKRIQLTPWVSDFHVASAEANDELSYYTSYMTVADEQGQLRFDELRACVLDWATRLRPAHGTAGFTVILEVGVSAISTGPLTYATLEQYSVVDILSAAPHVYETLQQYPGLDMQVPASFIGKVRGVFNRIKCINWLTVLGDAILEELGGKNFVQHALGSECILHPYPGGVVIQAGPVPRLGNVQKGYMPEQYCNVSRFTKPVRHTGYGKALFRVFEPMNGCEETEKWVKRFD